MLRKSQLLMISWLTLSSATFAEIPEKECVTVFSKAEAARPRATPVQVLQALGKLKKKDGGILIEKFSPELEKGVKKYFGADPKTSSRLEHFYALLFLIGQELRDRDDEVELDIESAKQLLKASHVFPTPQLIEAMSSVSVEWRHYSKKAEWEVKLGGKDVAIKMNDGQGFRAFNHGYCQRVDKLLIYGGFHVTLGLNKDENILVKFREPVDFEGDFGSRGVANVNVKYVSLYEIEFHHGSKLGTSKAKIAEREFEEGDHSWFLEMVASLVSEKSAQPIDW